MTKARGEQPDRSVDLAEAARAVVRDAGDPRIDAHLAALGLGPDPTPHEAQSAAAAAPVEPVVAAELATLHARVDELASALVTARRQVRWLTISLAAVLVAGSAVVLLLLGRAG